MSPLEELIDAPAVTAQQILDAAETGLDVFAAAAVVFARFEQATESLKKALDVSQALLARPPLPDYDTEGRRTRTAEIDFALQRAEQAQAATWAALERYAPWRESLDLLEAGLKVATIIESN
ncbi:MAG TPA: hypothetical protein VMG10_31015 [Gemmataceae bacterium]|nr:hypothetical protein [Gemmataceae bacterium]